MSISPAPYEISIGDGSAAGVRVGSIQCENDEDNVIFLKPLANQLQTSFLFRRGDIPPVDVPESLRGYAILLDQPVLIVKVYANAERSLWLMLDWNSNIECAERVILAQSSNPDFNDEAMILKSVADSALSIHRTFYR